MKRRRLMSSALAAGATWWLPIGPAGATQLVGVRVWPADDYSRLTLESDTPLQARHQLLNDPPRLLIELPQIEAAPLLKELAAKVRPDDPYIARVRVLGPAEGSHAVGVAPTTRFVLDLKQRVRPQQFALAPVAAYQHRLVFDLYPLEAPDPLWTLIQQRESAQAKAADAINDALGDFIRDVESGAARPPAVAAASAPAPARAATSVAPRTSDTSARAVARAPDSASVKAPDAPRRPVGAPPGVIAAPPTREAAHIVPEALQQRIDRLVVVALDPGHGGEDPGAIGPSGLREKDVVLTIGLKLRDRLNGVRGMRVMMTRDEDFFVPLAERVRKARRVQADLFVSLHADAFITPKARGASVFALSEGSASSGAARWLANEQNRADLVGGISAAAARDTDVMRAMLAMSTTAQIRDSLKLGREVLQRIGQVGQLHKRDVEQAGFAVLKAPDMPSILVETAFISNPEEEQRLADPAYQDKLVEALAVGIQRYFARNPPLARQRAV